MPAGYPPSVASFAKQSGYSGATSRESATDSVKVSDRAAVGELPTATRSNYIFLGWFTAAVGGELVSSETVVTADVTWYAQWKRRDEGVASTGATPTYGPFGESEDVANPDKLGPTMFMDVSLTIDGEPAAVGDCVAAYRGDTGALCGLGKVLQTLGSLTIVCYAQEGVALNFKAWTAASGIDDPTIVACGKATAPTAGEIVEETLTLAASTATPSYCVGTKCSIETGWIGFTVKNLPKGLKYDKKTGVVSGVPTAATASGKAVATFTKKGEGTQTLEFEVAALPSGATGPFNGFVLVDATPSSRQNEDESSSVGRGAGAASTGETLNAGTLQVTVSDVGKITAKVVAAAGTYSFTATGWDSVNEDVYSVKMTTKKDDVLTLACDSAAAWNAKQLTGTFAPWTRRPRRVRMRSVRLLNAATRASRPHVPRPHVPRPHTSSRHRRTPSANSGSSMPNLLLVRTRANLWFDKTNDHEEGVGSAVFVP